jgi:3-methyl-2-oxobutanoate hydroxymethyltransferase
MAQIAERAGADLLSIGDSVSQRYLGYENPDDMPLDEMIPFCRAVSRAAKRALVSSDMPLMAVNQGPQVAAEAAKRLRDEAGAEMVKVDIREDWDGLYPSVEGVLKTGIPVYPQIGFHYLKREGSDEAREGVLKMVQRLEQAGASMIDLTGVSNDVYRAACASTKLPIIGGQSGPESDGHIWVSYAVVGFAAAQMDKDTGSTNVAKTMYEALKQAVDNVRTGNY